MVFVFRATNNDSQIEPHLIANIKIFFDVILMVATDPNQLVEIFMRCLRIYNTKIEWQWAIYMEDFRFRQFLIRFGSIDE